MLKGTIFALGLAFATVGGAQAGCLTGAAAGAVVGHMAGHHGMAGAAVGCAVGHHSASKDKAAKSASQTPPDSGSTNH